MNRNSSTLAVGFDIGGTYVKVVAVSGGEQVQFRHKLPLDRSDIAELPVELRRQLLGIEQRFGHVNFVGIAAPGIVRPNKKSVS